MGRSGLILGVLLIVVLSTHCLAEEVDRDYYKGSSLIAGGEKPQPANLIITENQANDFTITWTQSIDPDDGQQVPDYFLYMRRGEVAAEDFDLSVDYVWQCTIGSYFSYSEERCQTERCVQIEGGKCSTVRAERRLALVFHNYEADTFSVGITGYDGQRESQISNIVQIETVEVDPEE